MKKVIHHGRSSVMASNLIRLSKSCIGDAEKEAVLDVLNREYLGMGQEVQLFENMLTEYFGQEATCVVNGTAALQLALQAAGVGYGHEVLVPSITYVASFQAISATGATPIACEIDPETFCLDVKDAELRISKNTKAIMPVHYAGGTGPLAEYYALASKYDLRVIEDAAHAFGSSYNGKLIGSFGDIICFSFDGIKNITSGEGGCIVTNDSEIIEKIKTSRLLGVEKDTEARFSQKRSWDVNVSAQGWRYHMSNIMAAIGVAQLKKVDEISTRRRKLAQRYNAKLESVAGVRPLISDFTNIVPHIYVVYIEGRFDRILLRETMLSEGIETGLHYTPNHLLDYFSGPVIKALPITEQSFPKILSLPLHPDLTFEDVDSVCTVLSSALRSSS